MLVKTFFVRKELLLEKIFGSKENFNSEKKCTKKILGPKKVFGLEPEKNYWYEKNIGSEKKY